MKQTRFLVVVHVYYLNQIDLISKCLKNIPSDYDLFITSDKKNKDFICKKISKIKPDFHFVAVANVGYDIWPFMKVINRTDLSKYDYLIKLHTKRDMPGNLPCPLGNGYFVSYGDAWSRNLLEFISTKQNLQKCVEALKNPDVGMCTRYNLIHGMANHCGVIDEAKEKYPDYIFGLVDYYFVAGTMFISKIEPIQLVKDMNITVDLFDKSSPDHKAQFAHVLERTFGEAVYKLNMKITDPFSSKKHLKTMMRKYNTLKFIRRFINIAFCWILIAKYRRKIKDYFFNHIYLKYLQNLLVYDLNHT